MSDKPNVPTVEEATLKYAISGIQAGANQKAQLMDEEGLSEQEATDRAIKQALGQIYSSGADMQEVANRVADIHGLSGAVLEALDTDAVSD